MREEIKRKHFTLPRNEFCIRNKESLCHGCSETLHNYFWLLLLWTPENRLLKVSSARNNTLRILRWESNPYEQEKSHEMCLRWPNFWYLRISGGTVRANGTFPLRVGPFHPSTTSGALFSVDRYASCLPSIRLLLFLCDLWHTIVSFSLRVRGYTFWKLDFSYALSLAVCMSLQREAKDSHADMQANGKEGDQKSAFPLASLTGHLGKTEENRTPTQPSASNNGLSQLWHPR